MSILRLKKKVSSHSPSFPPSPFHLHLPLGWSKFELESTSTARIRPLVMKSAICILTSTSETSSKLLGLFVGLLGSVLGQQDLKYWSDLWEKGKKCVIFNWISCYPVGCWCSIFFYFLFFNEDEDGEGRLREKREEREEGMWDGENSLFFKIPNHNY